MYETPDNFNPELSELVGGMPVTFDQWKSDARGRIHVSFIVTTDHPESLLNLVKARGRLMQLAVWTRPRRAELKAVENGE